jgi:hypothetical protein
MSNEISPRKSSHHRLQNIRFCALLRDSRKLPGDPLFVADREYSICGGKATHRKASAAHSAGLDGFEGVMLLEAMATAT